MRLKLLLAFLPFILATCTSANQDTSPTRLTIFAASSLTEPFSEIISILEQRHPQIDYLLNLAGSQQLAQQINEGAPADVFASANLAQMGTGIERGKIDPASIQSFATNRLVIIFPESNPGNLGKLEDLTQPGLRILLAAPEVPVGQYSLEFLEKASTEHTLGVAFKSDFIANVVSYEDNVKIVLAKVSLGEADAGIVYASDVSGKTADSIRTIEIPEELNVIASYPIAPILDSPNPTDARLFIDFVLSPEGQTILAKFGFTPINDVK
jgi:molybdate transport system substrate-binding protein